MSFTKLLACIMFALCQNAAAKILIFTYSYNRPDFIEIQYKTFNKFIKEDDYEFIVFNDARNRNLLNQINNICAHYGITCIRIPQEIHNRPYLQRWPSENYNHPTVRNCNVVQYSLDTVGFDHDDIVILFDSDMFLVKEFSIREFLKGYDLAGRLLGRGSRTEKGDIQYVWHGLTFLDMRAMPNRHTLNFNCGRVEGKPVDAGGHSYYYLKNNPTVKTFYINYTFSDALQCSNCIKTKTLICTHNMNELKKAGLSQHQIQLVRSIPTNGPYWTSSIEFFHNNSFLHYRCGTNWDNKSQEYHRQKTKALTTYINKILK